MKVIDLSRRLSPTLPVYPGTPDPVFLAAANLADQGFREQSFTLTTHMGTHVDAPAHMLEMGATLDQLSPETWVGPCCVADVRGRAVIGRSLVQEQYGKWTKGQEPDWLLIRTGWDEQWETDEYFGQAPALSEDAAQWIASLPLKGIGLDCPSPEPLGEEMPVHRILLTAGKVIVENLCGLDMLPGAGLTFICAPLPLSGADGAPCRCLVVVDETQGDHPSRCVQGSMDMGQEAL